MKEKIGLERKEKIQMQEKTATIVELLEEKQPKIIQEINAKIQEMIQEYVTQGYTEEKLEISIYIENTIGKNQIIIWSPQICIREKIHNTKKKSRTQCPADIHYSSLPRNLNQKWQDFLKKEKENKCWYKIYEKIKVYFARVWI